MMNDRLKSAGQEQHDALKKPINDFHNFNAIAFGSEMDLNRMGAKLGIDRKYRWEEPMKLNPVTFAPSLERDREQVYLYYFGGVVFLDCTTEVIERFLERLPQYIENPKGLPILSYHEEYRLEIDAESKSDITNDCAVLPSCSQAFLDIICFVIVKSVALEWIEGRIEVVFDEVEGMVTKLGTGSLNMSDKDMARLASSILSFKFTSIAHIMVLDKPDITWEDLEADRFYRTMANLFELHPRYQEIKHKSETLLDMTGVFTGLSHARRSARLEWIIIILIAFEIVLYVLEIFRHH